MTSIESFEIVLDHINVTFLIVQSLSIIYWFIARLNHLHLLNVLLFPSLKSHLQEIPKHKIDYPVQDEDAEENDFWE